MIASGGDWFPVDDPDWMPPIEWMVATVGTRPSAPELASMSLFWLRLFAEVDSIQAEAEQQQAKQQR